MKIIVCVIAVMLAAGFAFAAPNIPASELPGRERQRFLETPIDRYMDPLAKPRNAEPLLRWKCDNYKPPRQGRRRSGQSNGC